MQYKRPTKQIYRALFLALQADAKEYPGGIMAIAHSMGMNGHTLANGINPDNETLPPSFASILEIIVLAQAKRSVFAMAQMVNQITMDFELENKTRAEAVKLFLNLMHTIGFVLSKGSDAAKDGHFDLHERKEIEPLLLALMKATGELLQSVRG